MTSGGRLLGAVVAGAATAGLIGTPALAHVEVEADKAQAGARDVTLTFTGEAESSSAGIRSERVVLPAGLAPGDVTLVKTPAGWTFTPSADGFTVAGKALRTGQDAVWSVKIARLPPDATTLSFKTLETYGDGKVSRWIDLPKEGEAEPENPAPTIKLEAAAAPATSSPAPATSSPAPATSSPDATVSPSAPAPVTPAADDSGSGSWVWIVIAVVVILALGGILLLRRRGPRP